MTLLVNIHILSELGMFFANAKKIIIIILIKDEIQEWSGVEWSEVKYINS